MYLCVYYTEWWMYLLAFFFLFPTVKLIFQGIWYEKDALEIKEKLFSKYKYSFSFLNSTHDNDVTNHFRFPPPCMNDTEKLNLFELCNEHVCYSDPHRMEFFDCLEHECKMEDILSAMSESCLSCLYHGTVQDNFKECETEDYAFNPTGLLLLSKNPLRQMKREFFHDTMQVESLGYTYYKSHELIQRGYLDVNVRMGMVENLSILFLDASHPFYFASLKGICL